MVVGKPSSRLTSSGQRPGGNLPPAGLPWDWHAAARLDAHLVDRPRETSDPEGADLSEGEASPSALRAGGPGGVRGLLARLSSPFRWAGRSGGRRGSYLSGGAPPMQRRRVAFGPRATGEAIEEGAGEASGEKGGVNSVQWREEEEWARGKEPISLPAQLPSSGVWAGGWAGEEPRLPAAGAAVPDGGHEDGRATPSEDGASQSLGGFSRQSSFGTTSTAATAAAAAEVEHLSAFPFLSRGQDFGRAH